GLHLAGVGGAFTGDAATHLEADRAERPRRRRELHAHLAVMLLVVVLRTHLILVLLLVVLAEVVFGRVTEDVQRIEDVLEDVPDILRLLMQEVHRIEDVRGDLPRVRASTVTFVPMLPRMVLPGMGWQRTVRLGGRGHERRRRPVKLVRVVVEETVVRVLVDEGLVRVPTVRCRDGRHTGRNDHRLERVRGGEGVSVVVTRSCRSVACVSTRVVASVVVLLLLLRLLRRLLLISASAVASATSAAVIVSVSVAVPSVAVSSVVPVVVVLAELVVAVRAVARSVKARRAHGFLPEGLSIARDFLDGPHGARACVGVDRDRLHHHVLLGDRRADHPVRDLVGGAGLRWQRRRGAPDSPQVEGYSRVEAMLLGRCQAPAEHCEVLGFVHRRLHRADTDGEPAREAGDVLAEVAGGGDDRARVGDLRPRIRDGANHVRVDADRTGDTLDGVRRPGDLLHGLHGVSCGFRRVREEAAEIETHRMVLRVPSWKLRRNPRRGARAQVLSRASYDILMTCASPVFFLAFRSAWPAAAGSGVGASPSPGRSARRRSERRPWPARFSSTSP